MAETDLSSRLHFIHRRLLDGDPTASRDLHLYCLDPLVARVRRKAQHLPREMWEDAAIDAILTLIEKPESYDFGKGSVMTFLTVIAERRLIDATRREKRQMRAALETDLEFEYSVANDGETANTPLELLAECDGNTLMKSRQHQLLQESQLLQPEISELLYEILPDERDRQVLALIGKGRTATADYAAVLDLEHLPTDEQPREVKRNRDRIIKRVSRQRHRWEKLLR